MDTKEYIQLRVRVITEELRALRDQLNQDYLVEESESLQQMKQDLDNAIDACFEIW